MEKYQIIKLREYNILRGKDNSSTPIYPIVAPECIEGLEEYLQESGIGANSSMELVTDMTGYIKTSEAPEGLDAGPYYDLVPNKCYTLGQVTGNKLAIHFNDEKGTMGQYIIRFTASADNTNIVLGNDVYFPADSPSTVNGHSYELNVLGNVCLMTDITRANTQN